MVVAQSKKASQSLYTFNRDTNEGTQNLLGRAILFGNNLDKAIK